MPDLGEKFASPMSTPTLREWLHEGPFTLTLSSGFFGFFAHAGALEVLEDEGLLPSRLSGSSAGALVAGAWATGLSANEFAKEVLRLRREDFWDPALGLGLLRGKLFREKLEEILPRKTFDECRVPLSISVHDVIEKRTRVISSGNVPLAIHASCAVPFLFHPVWIQGRPHTDGGISDRPGILGVPTHERVLYHHLISSSPWRRKNHPSHMPTARDGLVTLAFTTLPRVGPYKLQVGQAAYDEARTCMRNALRSPVA